MTDSEKTLLEEASAGQSPSLVLRTRSRIDTGRWWRRSPVWISIVGRDLLLFAVSRRKFLNRVPVADCRSSWYCHASGALCLEPTEHLDLKQLAVTPGEALRLLEAIHQSA